MSASGASADLQNWGQCNTATVQGKWQRVSRASGHSHPRLISWRTVPELERASRGRFAPTFLLTWTDVRQTLSTFYYLSNNAIFGTKDSTSSLAYYGSVIKYVDKSRKLKKSEKIDFK